MHVFVAHGHEQEFRDLLPAMNAQCAALDDFLGVGSDADAPGPESTRWVLSYKYSSPEAQARCEEILRADLTAAAGIMSAPPVFEAGSRGSHRRPTEVITTHVPPDLRPRYAQLREEMDATVAQAPGFVSVDTFPPSGVEDTWVTAITFDSQASLDAWNSSKRRTDLVAKLHELVSDEVRTVPTGFGQWFSVNAVAMVQTPAWKQAMTVLAVLAPMVAILNITVGDAVGQGWTIEGTPIYTGLGLPFPIVVFIGNAIGTALLTWVLMPIVTRLLAWWLDPGATRRTTLLGAILLLGVYAAEIAIFTTINKTLGI